MVIWAYSKSSAQAFLRPTERTGLWPAKITPATLTEGELERQAQLQRSGLDYRQVVFFEESLAQSVWVQTMDEVARGELEGPFAIADVPATCPLSRRFGVQQNQKVRCKGDFSWSGVNSTAQPMESPKPHTLDVISSMLIAVMEDMPRKLTWVARSFDLKSAYRQCAVHPLSRRFAWIVVGHPATRSLKAFRPKGLAFGSVKSVHSFWRTAHSLWAILCSIFLVANTNYFDDFVTIASSTEAESVDYTVRAVFRLLGWRFAEDGQKAIPFGKILTALGVTMDVSGFQQGVVRVDNTDTRRQELAAAIDSILQARQMRRLDARRLGGRMQFAAGQLLGRISRRCLSIITQHAYSAETSQLSDAAIFALSRFKEMLTTGGPRVISRSSTKT